MSAIIAAAIVIHLTNLADVPAVVLRDAQQQVAEILRDAGVDVRWSTDACARGSEPGAVRLTLLPYETGALQYGRRAVLGAANRSGDGVGTAWVFYNRVTREADRHGVAAAPVLAAAIAHEIGHLLQPVPGHADRGLMRAEWNHGDYLRATDGRLRFSVTEAAELRLRFAGAVDRRTAIDTKSHAGTLGTQAPQAP